MRVVLVQAILIGLIHWAVALPAIIPPRTPEGVPMEFDQQKLDNLIHFRGRPRGDSVDVNRNATITALDASSSGSIVEPGGPVGPVGDTIISGSVATNELAAESNNMTGTDETVVSTGDNKIITQRTSSKSESSSSVSKSAASSVVKSTTLLSDGSNFTDVLPNVANADVLPNENIDILPNVKDDIIPNIVVDTKPETDILSHRDKKTPAIMPPIRARSDPSRGQGNAPNGFGGGSGNNGGFWSGGGDGNNGLGGNSGNRGGFWSGDGGGSGNRGDNLVRGNSGNGNFGGGAGNRGGNLVPRNGGTGNFGGGAGNRGGNLVPRNGGNGNFGGGAGNRGGNLVPRNGGTGNFGGGAGNRGGNWIPGNGGNDDFGGGAGNRGGNWVPGNGGTGNFGGGAGNRGGNWVPGNGGNGNFGGGAGNRGGNWVPGNGGTGNFGGGAGNRGGNWVPGNGGNGNFGGVAGNRGGNWVPGNGGTGNFGGGPSNRGVSWVPGSSGDHGGGNIGFGGAGGGWGSGGGNGHGGSDDGHGSFDFRSDDRRNSDHRGVRSGDNFDSSTTGIRGDIKMDPPTMPSGGDVRSGDHPVIRDDTQLDRQVWHDNPDTGVTTTNAPGTTAGFGTTEKTWTTIGMEPSTDVVPSTMADFTTTGSSMTKSTGFPTDPPVEVSTGGPMPTVPTTTPVIASTTGSFSGSTDMLSQPGFSTTPGIFTTMDTTGFTGTPMYDQTTKEENESGENTFTGAPHMSTTTDADESHEMSPGSQLGPTVNPSADPDESNEVLPNTPSTGMPMVPHSTGMPFMPSTLHPDIPMSPPTPGTGGDIKGTGGDSGGSDGSNDSAGGDSKGSDDDDSSGNSSSDDGRSESMDGDSDESGSAGSAEVAPMGGKSSTTDDDDEDFNSSSGSSESDSGDSESDESMGSGSSESGSDSMESGASGSSESSGSGGSTSDESGGDSGESMGSGSHDSDNGGHNAMPGGAKGGTTAPMVDFGLLGDTQPSGHPANKGHSGQPNWNNEHNPHTSGNDDDENSNVWSGSENPKARDWWNQQPTGQDHGPSAQFGKLPHMKTIPLSKSRALLDDIDRDVDEMYFNSKSWLHAVGDGGQMDDDTYEEVLRFGDVIDDTYQRLAHKFFRFPPSQKSRRNIRQHFAAAAAAYHAGGGSHEK